MKKMQVFRFKTLKTSYISYQTNGNIKEKFFAYANAMLLYVAGCNENFINKSLFSIS